jgi:sec-independent protein translocase protein TatB
MFDVGFGEILLLAVLGLLVFGPEKLPKAAADAARMLKQVKGMAANARQDLADSAGIDINETVQTVKSLGDFHPRKLATNFFNDEAPARVVIPAAGAAAGLATGAAAVNGAAPVNGAAAPVAGASGPADLGGRGAAFDPDAT